MKCPTQIGAFRHGKIVELPTNINISLARMFQIKFGCVEPGALKQSIYYICARMYQIKFGDAFGAIFNSN